MRFRALVEGADDEGAVEVAELTLAGDASELRRIAGFLEWVASAMEEHGNAFGHEHLKDYDTTWTSEVDVVVVRDSKSPTTLR